METVIVGAAATLLGVLLGGGVRAVEAWFARRLEADALLSALTAEVEALTRLVNHRGFLPMLTDLQRRAAIEASEGRGDEPFEFAEIFLKQNYFAVFDASAAKLGLLKPYYADRIVRFYTYAKATLENYDRQSPFQAEIPSATTVAFLVANDIELLQTLIILGNHIATFRPRKAPPGIIDPFLEQSAEHPQPELPQPDLSAADAEAAGTSKRSN